MTYENWIVGYSKKSDGHREGNFEAGNVVLLGKFQVVGGTVRVEFEGLGQLDTDERTHAHTQREARRGHPALTERVRVAGRTSSTPRRRLGQNKSLAAARNPTFAELIICLWFCLRKRRLDRWWAKRAKEGIAKCDLNSNRKRRFENSLWKVLCGSFYGQEDNKRSIRQRDFLVSLR